MSTVSKSQLSILETVYPPISNQEAVWLQKIPEVVERLRQSDFYMIAGRAEARYTDIEYDKKSEQITFNFRVGDALSDPVTLRLSDLAGVVQHAGDSYTLEAGEKMIRLWSGPVYGPDSDVLEWFTTEKLLWDRARGRHGIEGLARYREMATYDLLYVGIAKKGDSFDRLLAKGHKVRIDILSNEPQRYPGARPTDEIFLFLFKVEPLIAQTFELDHEFTDEDLAGGYDAKKIVADAEKAFVHLLKPQYNVVQYENYPKGADGLYGSDLVRYGYVIAECFAFNTAHGRIKGDRDPQTGLIGNGADSIFVEGDQVSFFVSGEDYPATP